MISVAYFLFALTCPLVLSAPTIDANTLLQNGEAAQQLNAEFQTLQVTDSCNSGDTACISGLPAQCTNGVWETQQCPGGIRQCFALPSVKTNGTFIACTSSANALSLIAATGAQGGITSNSNTTSNGVPPNTGDNGNGFSSSSSTSSGTTATVTQIIVLPTTFPPTTLTLHPAEASGLMSSFINAGVSPSVVSISTQTSTSSSSSVSTTSSGIPGAAVFSSSSSVPTTINLNRSPTAATTTTTPSASNTSAGSNY